MQIQVQQIIPEGAVAIGRGTDLATGDLVVFSGDWRPMRSIEAELEEHAEIVAEVADGAVVSRVDARRLREL